MQHRKNTRTKALHSQQDSFKIMMMVGVFASLLLAVTLSPSFAAGTYDPPKKAETKTMHKSMRDAKMALSDADYATTLRALAIVTNDEPKNADAWNLTGFALRKSGDYEKARSAYGEALRLKPDHKGALEYMGELHLTLGELPQAEALYDRLKEACSYICSERDTLKKAIKKYKKANS